MDARRFDVMTRTFGRRGAARLLLSLAGFGAALAAADETTAGEPTEFCEIKGKGERCRRGNQCCSGRCKRKNGKKRGKCRCSPLQARCSRGQDCCPPEVVNAVSIICGRRLPSIDAVCCMGPGGHCSEDADCCGAAACTGGQCEP